MGFPHGKGFKGGDQEMNSLDGKNIPKIAKSYSPIPRLRSPLPFDRENT
jgi:hypothetical protein